MVSRTQGIVVAGSILVFSFVAMTIVALAAYLGLEGDALTAMSTVLSTALAAVAIVMSLGTANLGSGREHGIDRSALDRIPQPGTASSLTASLADGRLEVDVEGGEVRLIVGGTRIVLTVEPSRIVVGRGEALSAAAE